MIPNVSAYLIFFLVVALDYALLCLGLNLQWGVTGLFNVGSRASSPSGRTPRRS